MNFKLTLSVSVLLITMQTFAAQPNLRKIAQSIKANDVRTVTSKIPADELDSCTPEGSSRIDLQVKYVVFDVENHKKSYEWETVKSVIVDPKGNQLETCGE